MAEQYSRQMTFENIPNFRDLGGYRGRKGRTLAWRRLYRSSGLLKMTMPDKARLKDEIHLKTAIDLRSPEEEEKIRETKLLEEIGVQYYNVPFRPDIPDYFVQEQELYRSATNMGEVYMHRLRHKSLGKRLIESLEIIAEPENLPLLFHCGAGKDRTGILTAILLSILGVSDADIIGDYTLTDGSMEEIRSRMNSDPATPEDTKTLPDFTWRAVPESIVFFLAGLEKEYGSAAGYLQQMGAERSLARRLEKALMV